MTSWLAGAAAGCRALFGRGRAERDLDDELQGYLDASTDAFVRQGMTPDAARRAARAAMGSVAAIKDHTRDAGWESWADGVAQDVRYAVRALRRAPGLSLAIFVTLAVVIGGNTAIFQLADAVRLRPLPVAHPEQILEIRMTHPERGRMGTFAGRRPLFTYALWQELGQRQHAFSGLAAWSAYPVNVAPGNTAQLAQGLWVSGGFFTTLGIAPQLGRLIDDRDDRPGCGSPVAVLGHRFWKTRYHGAASVVGTTITLDGRPFEIVGVVPRTFVGLEVGRTFDVATPLCAEAILNRERSALSDRAWWWLTVVGRLAPGWTAARASAHLSAIAPEMFRGTVPSGITAEASQGYLASTLGAFEASTGVSGTVREDYTTPLSVLLALAIVVLLIASANIATLLLARATARERDAAVRLALGAARGRLIRQLLMESAVLAALAAAAGTLLAQPISEGLVALLRSSGFQFFAIGFDLQPNGRVLAFSGAAAIVMCLLFGLAPALAATRPTRTALVRGLARSAGRVRRRQALRGPLVAAQISLAVVLVVMALLFSRTLRNLATADPGLDAAGVTVVVVMHPDLPIERRHAAEDRLLEAVRSMPDAVSAASTRMIPLTGEMWTDHVLVDGVRRQRQVQFGRVSAGYFATLHIGMVTGRDFSAADAPDRPRVAIVNESFARDVLNREQALGATFQLPSAPGKQRPLYEVVGVVKDAKHLEIRGPFEPMAFFPITQEVRPPEYVNLLVRLARPAAAQTLTEIIGRLEPRTVLLMTSLESQAADQALRERLLAVLSSAFAAAAALLAVVGLYGVVSFTVGERVQEIGIRVALGARGADVIRTILWQGLSWSAVGVAAGMSIAAAVAPSVRFLLYGLEPVDLPVFAGVAIAFTLVALAAAYLPARRATSIDPIVALRGDH